MDKYTILNYQSDKGIDGKPSYNFWFTSSLIRIIGNKPFGRGDIALIKNIKKPSSTEWNIEVDIIGDLELDPEAMELATQLKNDEIPTLVFATTKIYLDKTSDVHVYGTDNVEILLNCSSTMNDNKSYTIAALVKGRQGKLFGIDKNNGTSLEWLITDNPKR
jgi:hypothetical protein